MAGKARKGKAGDPREAAFLAMERDGVVTGDLAETFDPDAYVRWRAKRKSKFRRSPQSKAKSRQQRFNPRGAYDPDNTGMFRGK